jgi:hypothetical protein
MPEIEKEPMTHSVRLLAEWLGSDSPRQRLDGVPSIAANHNVGVDQLYLLANIVAVPCGAFCDFLEIGELLSATLFEIDYSTR